MKLQNWLFDTKSGSVVRRGYIGLMNPDVQMAVMFAIAIGFSLLCSRDGFAQTSDPALTRIDNKVDGFGDWLLSKIQWWGVVIGVVVGIIKFFFGSERDGVSRGLKSFGMAAGLGMLGYLIAWIFGLGEGGTFSKSTIPTIAR